MTGGVSVRDVDVSIITPCDWEEDTHTGGSRKMEKAWTPVALRQIPFQRATSLDLSNEYTQEQARGGRRDLCWRNNADTRGEMQAQKFINAYSAFLKRQGKLPIPGMNIALLLLFYLPFKLPSLNSADSANVVMLTYLRLGWYRQDRSSQGAPTSIHRLVLRSCRLYRSSRLPPQNRRCRSSTKGPRIYPQPWIPPIASRWCFRQRWP